VESPVDKLASFPQGINTYQKFSTFIQKFSPDISIFSTERQ
jgi:hypothetical protein